MKLPTFRGIVPLLLLGAVQTANAQVVLETFDSLNPGWATDRYAPAGFGTVVFDGDNRLQISISDADSAANRPAVYSGSFYNTQGKRLDVGPVASGWTASAIVYVDSAFNTTTGTLASSSLWTRDTNADENNAYYPTLGFTNASPNTALDPAATDRAFRFRAWDSNIGWINLGVPTGFAFDAWHTLSITATGSAYEYRIDGQLAYQDVGYSPPGSDGLKSVYVQAYNFGNGGYSVKWDNLTAIPEPSTYALMLSGGTMGLVLFRRWRLRR